jgi:FkbM family methyltransferase
MSHQLSNTTMIKRERLKQLKDREAAYFDLAFIKAMPPDTRSRCIDLLGQSKAQVRQDLFALAQLDFKTDGYFVEIGAGNGTDANNTFLLENRFGWTGILAEPASKWHDALRSARKARIDTRAVWVESGQMRPIPEPGVDDADDQDGPLVETVSLNDLLAQHDAPQVVDYLSIDTEGTEFDILQALDFDRWSFRVISVEHNYEARRDDVFALLGDKGYTRINEDASRFDDWYVKVE